MSKPTERRLRSVQEVAHEIDNRFCGDFPNADGIEPILREWAEEILRVAERRAADLLGVGHIRLPSVRRDLSLDPSR